MRRSASKSCFLCIVSILSCSVLTPAYASAFHYENQVIYINALIKNKNLSYSHSAYKEQSNNSPDFLLVASSNSEIEVLKQQNESLRETIRAQNDVIKQMQSGMHGGENLHAENDMLRQQIKQAAEMSAMNGKAASKFKEDNEILNAEIKKLKSQNNKDSIAGLKETISQLKDENQRLMSVLANASVTESAAGQDQKLVQDEGSPEPRKNDVVQNSVTVPRVVHVVTSDEGVAALLQAEVVKSPDVTVMRGASEPISGKSFEQIESNTVHVKSNRPPPEMVKPLLGSDEFALDSR